MDVFSIISLFGGLGLFLFGMTIMGNSLEKIGGAKTEKILRQLTSSPWRGMLFGTAVTAVIQSSSATTVILVGLVNSGIMKLSQAVGVIMGANIGTTVTAQIIRLSDLSGDSALLQFVKPSTLAPLAAVIGAVLFMFRKDAKSKEIGQILLGFGVLFTGMFAMESAVAPLASSGWFQTLFLSLRNPVLGVLAGMLVTAVIQSSSASVGILQALTVTGAVVWGNAIPIILGQNIGTCITAILASIGTSRAAKRVAAAHLLFNMIGTVLCLIVMYTVKAFIVIPFWNDAMNMGDIANFHTLFNLVCTIILLPMSRLLVKLAERIVPEKAEEPHPELQPVVLDTLLFNVPSAAIAQARRAVVQMSEISKLLCSSALDLLITNNPTGIELALQRENTLDKLEVTVSNYLVAIAKLELSSKESREVTSLLSFVSDFERIGDYAINIVERAGEVEDKKIVFSERAQDELRTLNRAVCEVIELTTSALSDLAYALKVEPLEETIDDICETLRTRHIERLKNGDCRIESGIVFLEALINYERISDHCSDVAAKLLSIADESPDTHQLLNLMHEGADGGYSNLVLHFHEIYRV